MKETGAFNFLAFSEYSSKIRAVLLIPPEHKKNRNIMNIIINDINDKGELSAGTEVTKQGRNY